MFPISDDAPLKRFPDVTYALLFVMALVFLYEINLPKEQLQPFVQTWGFTADRIFGHFEPLALVTLVTAIFLHGGWFHLIGNGWMLYLFGDNVEDRLGRFGYIIFFISCGVVANVVHGLFGGDPTQVAIGASGSIAGVMGAYMIMFPDAQVKIALFARGITSTFKVPALGVMLFWYTCQIGSVFIFRMLDQYAATSAYGASGPHHALVTSHVAYYAHIGGFLCGIVLGYLLSPKNQEEQNMLPQAEVNSWKRVR